MSASVTLRHNFETGHRLPHLKGKCESLHGHSWWVEVTITAPTVAAGVVVEFGAFKKALREWIDLNLDHGLMLGHDDPLAEVMPLYGKTYVFTERDGSWPTVENTAALLARVSSELLEELHRAPNAYVSRVRVSETHVNAATWEVAA